jgi:ATP-binding cassette subfamily C exporter for protease/lipase
VINNDLAHGAAMMIIASILAARVLAPFAQLVAQWRILSGAYSAYARLRNLLNAGAEIGKGMSLPPPTGEIRVENLSYAPGEEKSREPVLRNIHLQLVPGEVLLVTGPSASGKTTLVRLLAGLLAPSSGKVRFNGVDAYQWNKEELGPYLGYLPQGIELLDGSIAENICRFGKFDAQRLADVIDLLDLAPFIEGLPQGIHTEIGAEGMQLSGGRRQMIGLARALYGNPSIVILDEPNANLDEAGERTLQKAVAALKSQGTTFVIVSHLQGIKVVADHLLIMVKGQMLRYGKPAEVMASLQPQKPVGESRASV